MFFILAVSQDGVIGERVAGRHHLPWRIPEEYEYFLQKVTSSKTRLLCGRHTYECIKHEPNHILDTVGECVVLSRSEEEKKGENIRFVRTLDAVDAVDTLDTPDTPDIWCIGGATLYDRIEELRPTRVYLTTIKRDYNTGDSSVRLSDGFFEYLATHYRKIILTEKCLKDVRNNVWVTCEFAVYVSSNVSSTACPCE